jgi:hypothetical protein
MWKNTVEYGTQQMTIRSMRIACWIPKATNTRSEYVTLIAVPTQQWLHERASVLHSTYMARHVSDKTGDTHGKHWFKGLRTGHAKKKATQLVMS